MRKPELYEIEGRYTGRSFRLNAERIVVGRHPDCDIVLDLGAVSREHAVIAVTHAGVTIRDLNSRNGTLVNGQRIGAPRLLEPNDTIRICDTVFTFHNTSKLPDEKIDQSASSHSVVLDDDPDTGSNITSRVSLINGRSAIPTSIRPEEKLRALLDISQHLAKTLRLDDLLPKILTSLFSIFMQADRGFVILLDRKTGKLIPKAVKSRHEQESESIRISRTIVRGVIESKEAVLSADAADDSRFSASASIVDFKIHSMICAPLVASSGDVLGVIQIDTLDQLHRFDENDLQLLAAAACQAAIAIENAELHAIALHDEATNRELQIAHQVQMGLLPQSSPDLPGYEFFELYEPAQYVGGDYYDYVQLPDGRLAIIVADVSGKGVSASLLMARLSAEVRFSLVTEPTPVKAMTRLNRLFCDECWEGRFVTVILTVLNPETHELSQVNAGHPPTLLRDTDRQVKEIDPTGGGFPIGVDEDATYSEHKLTLQPGQSILLYTDGITDAMNRLEQWFGEQQLSKVFAESSYNSPVKQGQRILRSVRQFVGRHPQFDDRCMVIFGRFHQASPNPGDSRAK